LLTLCIGGFPNTVGSDGNNLSGFNFILMNSYGYFYIIHEIFLTVKKVRKIPTSNSQFFYFARVENDGYQIADAITI
jgi:hypothetical protein